MSGEQRTGGSSGRRVSHIGEGRETQSALLPAGSLTLHGEHMKCEVALPLRDT
jgi:hypothetical protein